MYHFVEKPGIIAWKLSLQVYVSGLIAWQIRLRSGVVFDLYFVVPRRC